MAYKKRSYANGIWLHWQHVEVDGWHVYEFPESDSANVINLLKEHRLTPRVAFGHVREKQYLGGSLRSYEKCEYRAIKLCADDNGQGISRNDRDELLENNEIRLFDCDDSLTREILDSIDSALYAGSINAFHQENIDALKAAGSHLAYTNVGNCTVLATSDPGIAARLFRTIINEYLRYEELYHRVRLTDSQLIDLLHFDGEMLSARLDDFDRRLAGYEVTVWRTTRDGQQVCQAAVVSFPDEHTEFGKWENRSVPHYLQTQYRWAVMTKVIGTIIVAAIGMGILGLIRLIWWLVFNKLLGLH